MPGFGISFEGLDELKLKLDSKIINKNIAKSIGQSIMQVHNAVRFDIIKQYGYNQKTLDSVLVDKSATAATQIGTVLTLGLVYNNVPIDLSKFPYTQNYLKPAPSTVAVTSVTVRRGVTKVVVGKSGNGGFVPRNRKNNTDVWRSPSGRGSQMFERIGAGRNHLRLLFGPSLSQMASSVVKQGSPELDKAMENVATLIGANIFND
jgi:hypothetical protein